MSTLTPVQKLKLYILANGIRISPHAEAAWHQLYKGPMTLNEYVSTSGVCLHTVDGVYMNAPFLEDFTRGTQALLDFDGEFFIVHGSLHVPVVVDPVPAFHLKTYTVDGVELPYTNHGVAHTDRCRVSPVGGCAWKCTFCDLPYEHRYIKKTAAQLLEVIELAVKDPVLPSRHVIISGGTPRRRDEAWIDEVYAEVTRKSPVPVDVMMPARHDMGYPAWLKSVGVNMISVNLEISDPGQALVITPHKAKQLGRQHYLDYIEKCVEAFGVGFVQSLMVFGWSVESTRSTLEGVQDLVDRGCIPVLSPFRPDAGTPMGLMPPASEEEMTRVYEASLEICERSGTGLRPGPRCIACHHNTVAFSDGSSFFVDSHGDLTAPL